MPSLGMPFLVPFSSPMKTATTKAYQEAARARNAGCGALFKKLFYLFILSKCTTSRPGKVVTCMQIGHNNLMLFLISFAATDD